MNRTIRLVPAVLLATVLAIAVAAGSATAAAIITGKQIKNGSVTGVDLRNGSVGPVDLAPAARNRAVTAEGADQNIDTCTDTALEECDSLVSAALTKGTWLVTATVTVDNFAGPATSLTDRCGLFRDGKVLAESRTPLAANGDPGEAESIGLTQVVVATTSSNAVSLRCTEMQGENLRIQSPTLAAVRVS
jgi:hypothetical protein